MDLDSSVVGKIHPNQYVVDFSLISSVVGFASKAPGTKQVMPAMLWLWDGTEDPADAVHTQIFASLQCSVHMKRIVDDHASEDVWVSAVVHEFQQCCDFQHEFQQSGFSNRI